MNVVEEHTDIARILGITAVSHLRCGYRVRQQGGSLNLKCITAGDQVDVVIAVVHVGISDCIQHLLCNVTAAGIEQFK